MTHRSPVAVVGLSFITGGIYFVYWLLKTTEEMNSKGADIPSAWLSLVPFVNLWWLYRWSTGVEHVTRGDWSATGALAVSVFLPGLGSALIQSAFNRAPSPRGVTGRIGAPA